MTPDYIAKARRRFEKKFDKRGDCWIWNAGLGSSGPVFGLRGRTYIAVRAAALLYKGEVLPPGARSVMTCGGRYCVNPGHFALKSGSVLRALDAACFASKYTELESGCWEWIASVDSNTGYGKFGFRGSTWNAHRVSWALHNEDPGELHVLHKCDNPPCVNPGHLFLGTNHDNVQDMIRKGRDSRGEAHSRIMKASAPRGEAHWSRDAGSRKKIQRGEQHWSRRSPDLVSRGDRHGSRTKPESVVRGDGHGRSKLTHSQAQEILDRSAKESSDVMAIEFGVSVWAVNDIASGRRWKHLSPSR